MEVSTVAIDTLGRIALGPDSTSIQVRIPQTTDRAVQKAFEESVQLDLSEIPALYDIDHLMAGVRYLDPRQAETFTSGCAEPWIAQAVCALLVASGQRVVLETGTFTGTTAAWLCLTLAQSGGGEFIGCELDPERAQAAQARLEALELPETVRWRIMQGDVLDTLKSIPSESLGAVWLDDCHEHEHVAKELALLMPLMVPKGIIMGHDVYGSCDLRAEFARYQNSLSLDLPRLGPAGGIGIIQT